MSTLLTRKLPWTLGALIALSALSAQAQEAPSEAPATPTEAQAAPSEAEAAPSEAVATPSEAEATPTEAPAAVLDEGTGEEEEETKLPWRGSYVAWSHAATKNSFDQSAELSYNPTYTQTLTIAPRWYLSDKFSLRARQDINLEVTEPDTYQQRITLTDTVLEGVYSTQLWELDVAVGPRLKLPVSLSSQAQDRYLGAGARLNVGHTFEKVAHGLGFTVLARYNHNFAGSNVALTDDAQECQLANGESSTRSYGCLGGGTNTSDDFYSGLEVSIAPLKMMTITGSFGMTIEGARGLAPADVMLLTGEKRFEDGSDTHFRHSTAADLSVAFQLTSWLELSAGASTGAPQKAADGTQRNPFWSYETELSAGLTVAVDELYLAAR